MIRQLALPTLVVLALGSLAFHAPAHEGHTPAPEAADQQAAPPGAIVLPPIEGPRPWSDKPILNDPDRFQIAILTDRTGGHRPGVWMDAVRKLNLLRPEFVVSVGDLIEGYTEDRAQIASQWEEFLGFIDAMQMRFFFVAGNHDITNPTMHTIWRERFGREWYSFDYRGVHFLCLNSEDPVQEISEEQLGFIERDLASHADARWTLVFLHKPLWTYAERQLASGGEDRTRWKRVEKMLIDRPHTVFAGHVHNYVQYRRNGRDYYSLATTGGGSRLRGNEYGEFDHITWLTMEADGPQIVNLRLDGILPHDVVTEASARRFREFLRRVTLEVQPILVDDESGFVEGEIGVRLINELGAKVEVTGEIDGLPLRGLTVDPEAISLAVGPTGEATQNVLVRFDEKVGFDRLRRATFTASVTATDSSGGAPLRAERTVPIVIDRRHACPPIAGKPFGPWPERSYETGDTPLLAGASQEWKGPNDAAFSIATAHAEDRLNIRVRVTDERVVDGDKITLVLDGRPESLRLADPRLRRGTSVLVVPAPGSAEPAELQVDAGWRNRPIEGAKAMGRLIQGGYELDINVPNNRLGSRGSADWESFQLSAIQIDVDDPNGAESEVIWRGTPDYRSTNANFARFYRTDP
ncbi:Calcineurin-like phosphoesterase superfamily domain protein [Planctomycetes bacterium MalM25]|nr:Calcineurin-like phosphoesterase superfamily domain protein [Planctomycetes bacterium MalM25]